MCIESIEGKQNVNVISNNSTTDEDDDNDLKGLTPDIIYKLNKLPAELRKLVIKYLDKGYSYDKALAFAEEEELEEKKKKKEKEVYSLGQKHSLLLRG